MRKVVMFLSIMAMFLSVGCASRYHTSATQGSVRSNHPGTHIYSRSGSDDIQYAGPTAVSHTRFSNPSSGEELDAFSPYPVNYYRWSSDGLTTIDAKDTKLGDLKIEYDEESEKVRSISVTGVESDASSVVAAHAAYWQALVAIVKELEETDRHKFEELMSTLTDIIPAIADILAKSMLP